MVVEWKSSSGFLLCLFLRSTPVLIMSLKLPARPPAEEVLGLDDLRDGGRHHLLPGRVSLLEEGQDIADAVMYLTDAATVTGHILYVDGGAHFGRW